MNDAVFYHEDFYKQIELSQHLSLKIPLQEINELLLPLSFNFFPEVKTGYSNQQEIKKDTVAFGFERLGIFIESNAGIVVNIWLCLSPAFKASQTADKLLNALHIIGDKYSLLLKDWGEETVIDLSSVQSIKNYLQETFDFTFSDQSTAI